MARAFTALSPSNQFNWFNALDFYNTVGGVSATETLFLKDAKAVSQMMDYSNMYYNLLGFQWNVKYDWEDSVNGAGQAEYGGTLFYNGNEQLYLIAPWVGDGYTSNTAYNVSPFGDDQGDPFIRHAYNAKGSETLHIDDTLGFQQNSEYELQVAGSLHFFEGSDVTPGNGQRNLFAGTLTNIANVKSRHESLFQIQHKTDTADAFGIQAMGISFVGGVDDMSVPGTVNDYRAFDTNIAGVGCYAVSWINGMTPDYEDAQGNTFSSSIQRQNANEAVMIKYEEETFEPGGEGYPDFSSEASIEMRTTGLVWNSYG